jgi:hypothetical protein
LAYIKILESDFLSTNKNEFSLVSAPPPPGSSKQKINLGIPKWKTAVNICIYTRKGRDYRTMRGGMSAMTIQGYTQVLLPKPDNIDLFWHPMDAGRSFIIRFNNSKETRAFRINVDAMTYKGQVFHYETVVRN